MARVYPKALDSLPSEATQKETLTIWMKSLVCQTNGLTVYNSKGEVVYRVKSYEKKCCSEVHFMDLQGHVLFTIRTKKLWVFRSWYVYEGGNYSSGMQNKKPLIRVRRFGGIFKSDSSNYELRVGNELLWILRLDPKSAFRILDIQGDVIADTNAKQSTRGVTLGKDVISLEVKPCIDHSLAAAIAIVYGLIKRRI